MANYPSSAPSVAPGTHQVLREELLAVATDLLGPLGRFPGVGPYISGRYYDGAQIAHTGSVQTYGNNNTFLAPFWCHEARTFDRIGIVVTTAVAGSIRLGVYAGDLNTGWPVAGPLLDAGTVDAGTTGGKEITISLSLSAHRLYWLAMTTTANNVAIRSRGGFGVGNGLSSLTVDNNTERVCWLTSAGGTLNTAGGTPTVISAETPGIRMRAA